MVFGGGWFSSRMGWFGPQVGWGVAQRGGAAGLRAKRGVGDGNKAIPHNHAIARFGGFFLSLRNDHFT